MKKQQHYSFINSKKYLYKMKGSLFITYAIPIKLLTDFEITLINLKKEHSKANHLVWGYCIWNQTNFNYGYFESTEPKKTSGFQIFNFLKAKNLFNVAIIIVRYKKGSNLGIGLLSRSYLSACNLTTEQDNIKLINYWYKYELETTLENQKILSNFILKNKLKVIQKNYLEKIVVVVVSLNELIDEKRIIKIKFVENFWN